MMRPQNTTEHYVFLKVATLNSLYSTQMPVYSPNKADVGDLARYIWQNGQAIDHALATGDAGIVDQVVSGFAGSTGKRNYRPFSLTTKYCSWHRPDCYPIWDSRVQLYLGWLQKELGFGRDFKLNGSWKYQEFRDLIARLRNDYGLEEFSFKQLDKFMYQRGGDLFQARPA